MLVAQEFEMRGVEGIQHGVAFDESIGRARFAFDQCHFSEHQTGAE